MDRFTLLISNWEIREKSYTVRMPWPDPEHTLGSTLLNPNRSRGLDNGCRDGWIDGRNWTWATQRPQSSSLTAVTFPSFSRESLTCCWVNCAYDIRRLMSGWSHNWTIIEYVNFPLFVVVVAETDGRLVYLSPAWSAHSSPLSLPAHG